MRKRRTKSKGGVSSMCEGACIGAYGFEEMALVEAEREETPVSIHLHLT